MTEENTAISPQSRVEEIHNLGALSHKIAELMSDPKGDKLFDEPPTLDQLNEIESYAEKRTFAGLSRDAAYLEAIHRYFPKQANRIWYSVYKEYHLKPHKEEQNRTIGWIIDSLHNNTSVDWVVDELIGTDYVSMWVGESGVGKTMALLDLSFAVASGQEWLNRKTKQATALYIDEENGKTRFFERARLIMNTRRLGAATRLAYLSLPGFNLGNPEDLMILHDKIKETNAGFVVIDAFVDVLAGGDENSSKDVQPIFTGLRRIADTHHCSINLIHHNNKQGGFRGSSAMKGAVDVMISLTGNKPQLVFKSTKARDYEGFTITTRPEWKEETYRLHHVKEGQKSSPDFQPSSEQRAFMECLSELGQATLKQIGEHLTAYSPNQLKTMWQTLKSNEYAYRVDGRGQGATAILALTELGVSCISK